MSSSLFSGRNQQPQQSPQSDLIAAVNEVKRQIGNQDPNVVLQQLCQHNPQIRSFVQQLKGLSPMQIAAQFFKK